MCNRDRFDGRRVRGQLAVWVFAALVLARPVHAGEPWLLTHAEQDLASGDPGQAVADIDALIATLPERHATRGVAGRLRERALSAWYEAEEARAVALEDEGRSDEALHLYVALCEVRPSAVVHEGIARAVRARAATITAANASAVDDLASLAALLPEGHPARSKVSELAAALAAPHVLAGTQAMPGVIAHVHRGIAAWLTGTALPAELTRAREASLPRLVVRGAGPACAPLEEVIARWSQAGSMDVAAIYEVDRCETGLTFEEYATTKERTTLETDVFGRGLYEVTREVAAGATTWSIRWDIAGRLRLAEGGSPGTSFAFADIQDWDNTEPEEAAARTARMWAPELLAAWDGAAGEVARQWRALQSERLVVQGLAAADQHDAVHALDLLTRAGLLDRREVLEGASGEFLAQAFGIDRLVLAGVFAGDGRGNAKRHERLALPTAHQEPRPATRSGAPAPEPPPPQPQKRRRCVCGGVGLNSAMVELAEAVRHLEELSSEHYQCTYNGLRFIEAEETLERCSCHNVVRVRDEAVTRLAAARAEIEQCRAAQEGATE